MNFYQQYFKSKKMLTTKQIHDKIVSGELTVDFDKLFIGYNAKKYLLSELLENDVRINRFGIYSSMIGEKIGIRLIDNVLKFQEYHHGVSSNYPYKPIELDQDIEDVNGGSFDVPSKLLFIANNFTEAVNPEPADNLRFGEMSLNSYQGRKRIGKWYLENNKVAYGQMGNMSIAVYYSKKKNHIIFGEDYEWNKVSKEFKELIKGYKHMGRLSLSYWRWEATDSTNVLSKSTIEDEKEIIQIPINGTNVRFEHYYDGLKKSPITKYGYAQMWIEN